MASKKKKLDLSILEAVDNLSNMANLDLEEGKRNHRALLEKLKQHANWLSYQSKRETDDKIKTTFSTIHRYLEHFSSKVLNSEKKAHFRKGVHAIQELAYDAIRKVDELKKMLHPNEKVTGIEHFEEVKLLEKFLSDFEKFEPYTHQENEGIEAQGSLYSKAPKDLIKDFAHLQADEDYELLFIRREDGLPFFSQELLTHAKYIFEFDESFLDFTEQNPLRMMKVIQDEEACMVAEEIYQKAKNSLDPFLKGYKSHQQDTISQLLYSAVIALVAAKNPQNLLKAHKKKNCLSYFKDFHYYLTQVTSHQLLPHLNENTYHQKAKEVIQALNGWFFLHQMHHPKAVEIMKQLLSKGQLKPMKRHSIWTWFLGSYDILNREFHKIPSGPIYKLIQQYENGDFDYGFNSIHQGNLPCSILTFELNHHLKKLLYLPSPTQQSKVSHAEILSEFDAFLNLNPSKSLLLFNLQDRQMAAKARSEVIENAEISHPNLFVFTLPKDQAFYHQEERYEDLDEAPKFLKALYEQILGAPLTGFHFPKQLKIEDLKKFSKQIIAWIHRVFFAENPILTRKNRQDFIEIFYGFLIMKIVDEINPDYISFTCKDALDIGSLSTLQFFTFLKFFQNPQGEFSEDDHDRLIQIALVPAFLNRGRLTLLKRIERMLSALATFEQAFEMIPTNLMELQKLYKNLDIGSIDWLEEAS